MSIRKHTIQNLVGALLPIAFSLITIPYYVGLIGDARYGVLAIAWLLLDYFGLFDLGLGRATAQRIASLAAAGPEQRATSFWTALTINVGLGVLGGLVIWPVAVYLLGHSLQVEDALSVELGKAIPWLVLAVPLATLSGVLSGTLQGRAQFLELNIISLCGSILIQLVPLLVALLYGPDLALLLPAAILSRVATLCALFWRCREHVFKGQQLIISQTHAKGLLQFGGWVTISALVSPMMVLLDRFVIGIVLGTKSVTYYTIPFQLAQRLLIIPGALSSAIFPRMAATDFSQRQLLWSTAIHTLAVIITPVFLIGILLIDPFISWWISAELASKSAFISQILLLGFWINSFAVIPYALLQAIGRPDIVAKCHLVEVLPYLLFLYAGLHFYGLEGAAMAFSLRTLIDCFLLMFLSGNLREAATLLYRPALMLLGGLMVATFIAVGSITWWVMACSLIFLSLLWAWKNAPENLRSEVIQYIYILNNFKSRFTFKIFLKK